MKFKKTRLKIKYLIKLKQCHFKKNACSNKKNAVINPKKIDYLSKFNGNVKSVQIIKRKHL